MNLKTKQQYQRIQKLTNIKSFEDIERLINRLTGYFNKIKNNNERINKGHIMTSYFILEDIVNIQQNTILPINYGTHNKIILEYGERILEMRYKDNYSFTMIVNELRTRYKKKVSRSLIYKFIQLNKNWDQYYG